jgi:uncharacterized SAM-binding protein YcdF (DUF218 family)
LVIAAIGLPLAVFGLALLVTWTRIRAASRADRPTTADRIVILGAQAHPTRPSAELSARLDHAAELWRAGVAPRLICSGGWDGETCEPLVMAEALVGLGIPAGRVEVDDRGHNTSATVAGAAGHASAGADHVLLVSSPYHLCRLQIEARRAGLRASVSAPASTPITRNRTAHALQQFRETIAIWRSWCRDASRRGPSAQPAASSTTPDLTDAQAWRS